MTVNTEEIKDIQDLISPGEEVELTVKQRRVGPGGSFITPSSVIATSNKIIIINRTNAGLRKDYEIVPYEKIASVRLAKGIISSSVYIRVEGYDREKGLLKNGKEEGEIDGLNNRDAKDLADQINKKMESPSDLRADPGAAAPEGKFIYCQQCGAKNNTSAKFCSRCGSPIQ